VPLPRPSLLHAILQEAHAKIAGRFTRLTGSDYQTTFNVYVSQGAIPTQLRGYFDPDSQQVLYDVTFSENTNNQAFEARHGIDNATFESENAYLRALGYSLTTHSIYSDANGETQHAAVWTLAA
jgi:hypothetical protein